MKVRLTYPLVFATSYLIISTVLLTVFGGAGHGWGLSAFFYVGLPLSYLSLIVEDYSKSGELAMLSCLLAGLVQYALLGYVAQKLIDIFAARR